MSAVERLRAAVRFVETHHPLPRCDHGNALEDHAGERLEPTSGCRIIFHIGTEVSWLCGTTITTTDADGYRQDLPR